VDRLVIVQTFVRAVAFYAGRHPDASVVTVTFFAASPQTAEDARDVADNSGQWHSRKRSESTDLVQASQNASAAA
jgi:hypothetical protein